MFCRACWRRSLELRVRGVRCRGTESGGSKGGESPLRRLLDGASAFGEAAPAERDLQWATQPYASPAPSPSKAPAPAPHDASVLLFPGQGAHFVGMGKALAHIPAARRFYDFASEVLGWDVWKVCTEGPPEELERRVQPALLATMLAGLERARDERPAAVDRARAVAGFSLGELAALVFAGALSADHALRLSEVREEAMLAAARERPGGMLALWLAPAANVGSLMRAARDHAAEQGVVGPVCEVANYLYPGCKVVAGDEEALRWLQRAGSQNGIRRSARVAVAGAWHCSLMESTCPVVAEALAAGEVKAPRVTVWSCTTARPYRSAQDVKRGVSKLAARAVRWEQTLHGIFARPPDAPQPLTLVMGPARDLRAMLRQVNARAWDVSLHIPV